MSQNPPLFPDLTFSLPSFPSEPQHWAVLGPSNAGKTTLFQVLQGQHLCFPSNARSYPFLSSPEIRLKGPRRRNPSHTIQYVGFNGEGGGVGRSGTRGAYLSARYESRREDTDFSVMNYLKGNTELNPSREKEGTATGEEQLKEVIKDLRLEALVHMPMGNLSNGQTRRARIAKALLGKPELLLLDEPFSRLFNSPYSNDRWLMRDISVGLDPPTLTTLSPLLHDLAKAQSPRLMLALRPQDPLPEWITHLIYLGPYFMVLHQGKKENVLEQIRVPSSEEPADCRPVIVQSMREREQVMTSINTSSSTQGETGPIDLEAADTNTPPFMLGDYATNKNSMEVKRVQDSLVKDQTRLLDSGLQSREGILLRDKKPPKIGQAIVEMENVLIKYGGKQVLGGWTQNVNGHLKEGLWWTVRRGERWGIFGPNGTFKFFLLLMLGLFVRYRIWENNIVIVDLFRSSAIIFSSS